MSDPYVYPGTSVLKNKLGERDADALDELERRVTTAKLLAGPPKIRLTPDGFRALHRHLFEDLYDWAGELRTVELSRGRDPFCFVRNIAPQLADRFAKIRRDRRLKSDDPAVFAAAASEHINELNAIHPFRDGNGCSTRLLLSHLAERAGYDFRIARLDRDEWMSAIIEGFRKQNYEPLARVIQRATRRRSRARPTSRKAER